MCDQYYTVVVEHQIGTEQMEFLTIDEAKEWLDDIMDGVFGRAHMEARIEDPEGLSCLNISIAI